MDGSGAVEKFADNPEVWELSRTFGEFENSLTPLLVFGLRDH